MFSRAFLLTSVSLYLSTLGVVDANPVKIRDSTVTLPFAKRVNATGTLNLVAHDRARVQGLRAKGSGVSHGALQPDIVGEVPATNQAVDYVVNVQIGNPPTTCGSLYVIIPFKLLIYMQIPCSLILVAPIHGLAQ